MPPVRLCWRQRGAQLLRKHLPIKASLWNFHLKVKNVCQRYPGTQGLPEPRQTSDVAELSLEISRPAEDKALHLPGLFCYPLILVPPCTEPEQGLTPLGLEELAQMSEEISQLYWILEKHCTDGAWMGWSQGCCSSRARFQHWLCAGMVKLGFWLTSPAFLCPAVKTKTNQQKTTNKKIQTKPPKQTKYQNQD